MEKKIVGFKLKEDDFAFDIMRVIEIIRLKDITEVPTDRKSVV
jgi:chemotaxis signal transduction protein